MRETAALNASRNVSCASSCRGSAPRTTPRASPGTHPRAEDSPARRPLVLVVFETRPEEVEAGAAMLVGTETSAVVAAASRLLTAPGLYESMSNGRGLHGDGLAGARIAESIRHYFGLARSAPAPFVTTRPQ